jgi:hypothetical protein
MGMSNVRFSKLVLKARAETQPALSDEPLSAPGMFGVSLWSTSVSVALHLGPSGASLSGQGNG